MLSLTIFEVRDFFCSSKGLRERVCSKRERCASRWHDGKAAANKLLIRAMSKQGSHLGLARMHCRRFLCRSMHGKLTRGTSTRLASPLKLPRHFRLLPLHTNPPLLQNTSQPTTMARAESSKDASTNGTKASASNASANYELPWVEKYRPVFLDDIVGNTETIERLKIIAKDGNMPHVIISGMPGIGKTTSILCLARQLLGDAYKEAVLELNASDERGIDVVRNRIKGFAQKKVTLPAGRQKIVILDEADSMTSGAQQALRRTMEIYSGTTRFAFACNQSNKIIEPLQSRCAILRYSRLTDGQVVKRLYQICKAEEVEYSDDGIAALVFSAEGDMRQAINNLQSTSAGFGFVNGDNVFRVVDSPHPIKVQAMIRSCHEQKVDEALESLKELW